MSETIAVTANPASLLQALSATFTNHTTVLGELLQNARRAGATRVDIELDDQRLVVADNGCGVEDFSKLLAIAQSGWDEEVIQNDSPYGIGWIATLYACERVVVHSRDRQLDASTKQILALEPVGLAPAQPIGGTRIELHGQTIGPATVVASTIRDLVRGYPVPVWFNGEQLTRQLALNDTDFITTPIGQVHRKVIEDNDRAVFFLQGLPITTGAESCWGSAHARPVHLDTTVFKGRMPDRDILLDPTKSLGKINQALWEAADAYLVSQREALGHARFVETYWARCVDTGHAAVLGSCDCVPRALFCKQQGQPGLRESDWCYAGTDGVFWRRELEAMSLFNDASYDGTSNVAAAIWCGGGLTVARPLNGHWLEDLLLQPEDEDFTAMPGKLLSTTTVGTAYRQILLRLYDRITLVPEPAIAGHFPEPMLLPSYYDYKNDELWVTPGCDTTAALLLVNSYIDDEHYEDALLDRDADWLHGVIQVMQTGDASALVRQAIISGVADHYSQATKDLVYGRSYTVTIAEDGDPQVVEQVEAEA